MNYTLDMRLGGPQSRSEPYLEERPLSLYGDWNPDSSAARLVASSLCRLDNFD
jgi:hypothetical protein